MVGIGRLCRELSVCQDKGCNVRVSTCTLRPRYLENVPELQQNVPGTFSGMVSVIDPPPWVCVRSRLVVTAAKHECSLQAMEEGEKEGG